MVPASERGDASSPRQPTSSALEPRYHIYVRLPFKRGNFVDPPDVNWNESKSEALWSIISGVAQTDIDWDRLAVDFGATKEYILQVAAYLTDRHGKQLRAQMARAANKGSNASSPLPPTTDPTTEPRTPSAAGFRAPSALSMRQAGTAQRRRVSSLTVATSPTVQAQEAPQPARDDDPSSPGPAEEISPVSSESASPVESRIMRRLPRFQADGTGGMPGDEDEEAEAAFLPVQVGAQGSNDLGATLRGEPTRAKGKEKELPRLSRTSDEWSNSSSAALASGSRQATADTKRPGPLSPRRTAELLGRSPAGKGKGYSLEGSEGTPSMGSSFSDLDDASVTQSALEEALASKMQDPTIGSRMSNFGQAFRSRYLPK